MLRRNTCVGCISRSKTTLVCRNSWMSNSVEHQLRLSCRYGGLDMLYASKKNIILMSSLQVTTHSHLPASDQYVKIGEKYHCQGVSCFYLQQFDTELNFTTKIRCVNHAALYCRFCELLKCLDLLCCRYSSLFTVKQSCMCSTAGCFRIKLFCNLSFLRICLTRKMLSCCYSHCQKRTRACVCYYALSPLYTVQICSLLIIFVVLCLEACLGHDLENKSTLLATIVAVVLWYWPSWQKLSSTHSCQITTM